MNHIREMHKPFCISLFLCIACVPLASAAPAITADKVILQAKEKKLAQDPYWLTLLHYQTGFFGTKSLIDDETFFLSEKGKTHPEAELVATIKAFFAPVQEDPNSHAICRFPARCRWISKKLDIPFGSLPAPKCDMLNTVMERISPVSSSLSFPTYFMNSPASIFGHTLINMEPPYESKLLSQAVNYSAKVDDPGSIFFPVKGIFGFYKGYHAILPYYLKIQEYNDISQRDIWEYRLNLTPAEMRTMLLHLWELRDKYAYYYFFRENCSYNLLFLLEAARPGLCLHEDFFLWALPVDTIKAVIRAGLVEDVEYRPSRATHIQTKLSLLQKAEKDLVYEIIFADQDISAVTETELSRSRKILVLDTLTDLIRYRFAKKKLDKNAYQKKLISTLRLRSTLGASESPPVSPSPPPPPHEIHGTRRLCFSQGVHDSGFFQRIAFRPALGDLLDTEYGYDEGAQVVFGEIAFDFDYDTEKLSLERLDIVDVVSVSAYNRFFRPLSWKLKTGAWRHLMPDEKRSLVSGVSGGMGIAANLASKKMDFCLVYGFGMAEAGLGYGLDEGYIAGAGGEAGLLVRWSSVFKTHMYGRHLEYRAGDTHGYSKVYIGQNIRISGNHHININCSFEQAETANHSETSIDFLYFF